jgi:hypothetical protein
VFKSAEIRSIRNRGASAQRLCAGLLLGVWSCSGHGTDTSSKPVPGLIVAGTGSSSSARGSSGSGAATTVGKDPSRCVEGHANASRVTPRVILVLDGSCSMSTDYPANGAMSASDCKDNPNGRWAALRRSLVDPQSGVVPKLQSAVQFGVVVFGTQPMCPIPSEPVSPALNNLAMIEAKMPMVQPGMYTPTGPALDWVFDNLITAGNPDDNLGPQIVILATDGEPNSCGGGGGGGRGQVTTNYQPSIDAVKKGTALGVTTYVISLADSNGSFHDHLQQLANLGNPGAGGQAQLYEPGSPAELTSALETLIGGAVGCDIAVNGMITSGSECKGTVMLNGAAIGCNQPDGWKLLDDRHIRLQGASCKSLMDNKNALVDARFPCDTFSPD